MTHRVAGHFGEWLQGRDGPEGPVVLVTVPCPQLGVSATKFCAGALEISGAAGVLETERAKLFLNALGADVGGLFELTSEMQPGGGAGVSTASLLALAAAAGITAAPDNLAKACLVVEGAVDPLMIHAPEEVIWASRQARVIERLAPLPEAEIVGGFWSEPVRTRAEDQMFPDISDLIQDWRLAAASGSLKWLAQIASASAMRTTELRGPVADPAAQLADELGALGYVRAHTGSARGLIFRPGECPAEAERVLEGQGFKDVIRFLTPGRA